MITQTTKYDANTNQNARYYRRRRMELSECVQNDSYLGGELHKRDLVSISSLCRKVRRRTYQLGILE